MMKKILAALLAMMLVLAMTACSGKETGTVEEESTLSQEEINAQLTEAVTSLTEYKTRLDEDLTKVNSADGAESFFDLKGMGEAAATLEALAGKADTASIENYETAAEAAAQYKEIAAKVDSCAEMYVELFKENYNTEPKEVYALVVFMSGEPSTFFAVKYEDEAGAEKTLYACSSYTEAVNMDTLRSILENLFMQSPVSTRNAETNGNYTVDLTALSAPADGETAQTEAEETETAETEAAETEAEETETAETEAVETEVAETEAAETEGSEAAETEVAETEAE